MIFNAEDVKSRFRLQPFTPVQLVTTTGATYDIYHPDLVWVGSRFLMIGTPDVTDPTLFDKVTRLALVHLTEMRDLSTQAAPSNGQAPG